MHSKQSRGWDRGSPGRRRPGVERGKNELFHRIDTGSPDRSKRSRWHSPPRNRMGSPARARRRDFESPPRAGRKDVPVSPRSRRGGFHDGPILSLSERRRHEEDYHVRSMLQNVHQEARGPAGVVFLCSSSMLRECFFFRVLGLPASQRDIVEQAVPGTKLFLVCVDTKELFGVFEAASRGGLNLEPEAFIECKEKYAAQVRFNILSECLPLAGDIVQDVLRENFSQRGNFDCELSADQVLKILQLFSLQEMHLRVLDQEREQITQDSRNMCVGINGMNTDGHPADGGGPLPDPAVLLGQGMLEEADQLALKYLQNNLATAGLRFEPSNTSLLSSSLRNNAQPSLSNAPKDHDEGGCAAAANLQPNGIDFLAGPNQRLGFPGGSVPDAANIDRMEHQCANGGKIFGQSMPGALAGGEGGLLPMPHMPGMPPVNQAGFPTGLPNQPGMIHPFFPAGYFPIAAGPVGGMQSEFGGQYMLFHPFQGALGLPPQSGILPQLGNSLQVGNHPNNRQGSNFNAGNRSKKNRQQMRSLHQKVLTGKKNDIEGASTESAEA